MISYEIHKNILEFSQAQGVNYYVAGLVLEKFNKIVKRLEKGPNKRNLEEKLERIKEPLKRSCLRKNVKYLVENGNLFEAYVFAKNNGIKIKKFESEKISKKSLEEIRAQQISTVNERWEDSQPEKAFSDYNDFIRFIGVEGNELSHKDIPFADFFEYGPTNKLRLERGDCGKCILYLNYDTRSFCFSVSKMEDVLPKDTSKEGLREFFKKEAFSRYIGAHRQINRPENVKIRGGGAYFMLSDKEIFIDYDSGDFGPMNKEVLSRCLKNMELEMTVLNDDYFDKTPIEIYIARLPNLSQIINKGMVKSNNKNQNIDEDIPDEDIPF